MKLTFRWALIWAAFPILGCTPILEEIDRVKSPGGQFDAVVFIRQTDATVASPIEIHILPVGGRVNGKPVWRADKVSGMKLSWESAYSLRISAAEARVFLVDESATVYSQKMKKTCTMSIVYSISQSL